MENVFLNPSLVASARRIRTQAEWNVETHIALARPPTSPRAEPGMTPGLPILAPEARA